jgi:uncharacterized protein YqeY
MMMEDKIRQLCARAIAAGDDDLKDAISELQAALRQHTQDLRKTLIEQLGGRKNLRHPTEGK